jgi:hypothetical protein
MRPVCFLQTAIDAINAAAPAGYARSYADVDRIGLARIDGLGLGSWNVRV